MLLKQRRLAAGDRQVHRFSTLYRVDAIEADQRRRAEFLRPPFQYPLSGRCY